MRVLGIAVHFPSKGRPAARAVLLDGSWSAPKALDEFELTSAATDLPTQLRDLADGLRSRLKGLTPERVVIRRADYAPASNKPGPRLRLLAEGALAAAARAEIADVVLLEGKDLAARCPAGKKSALDLHASTALPNAPAEAAAAALAGIT
jgi:hypothetical protein